MSFISLCYLKTAPGALHEGRGPRRGRDGQDGSNDLVGRLHIVFSLLHDTLLSTMHIIYALSDLQSLVYKTPI
jgi:hypothetical protein